MAEFEVGDLVWAKMKGWSPWPARIIEPVKNVKPPKAKEPVYCVTFYGTKGQIAYVVGSDILSFEEGKEKCAKKKLGGTYKAAVDEMCAAAASNKYSKRSLSIREDHDDNDEESEDEDDNESDIMISQSSKKGKSTSNKKRLSSAKNSVPTSTRKPLFNPEQNQNFTVKRKINKSNSKSNEKRQRLIINPSTPEQDSFQTVRKSFRKDLSQQHSAKKSRSMTPPSAKGKNSAARVSSGSLSISGMSNSYLSVPLPPYDQEVIVNDKCIHLSSTNIGFIGLGTMGKIILDHLIASKTSDTRRNITIWNRTYEKCLEYERKGCAIARTPAELMMKSDIVINCVSDRSAVKAIVYAENIGILAGLRLGKGYVEMTTIDPEFSQNICRNITKHGGRYLEVAMLGRRKHARDASLLLLAAGDKDLFNACRNCFRDMGEHVFFFRDVGNASKMNLIINMVLGTCFATVTEALGLAKRAGICPKDVLGLLEQANLNCPAIIDQGNDILKLQENLQKKYDNMNVENQQNLHQVAITSNGEAEGESESISEKDDLNLFDIKSLRASIEDLSDGVAIAEVLNYVSPDFFTDSWLSSIRTDVGDDQTLWVGNLRKILQRIDDFNSEVLGQEIEASKMPNINAIGEKYDPIELGKLLQLVLECAVDCDSKYVILKLQENIEKKYDNMPVEHMQRNLHLALEVANNYSQPIPTIAAVNDVYQTIRKHDQFRIHRSDVSEMYKVLTEKFIEVPIRQEEVRQEEIRQEEEE